MPPTLTPQQFVAKWNATDLTERASAQSHFIDLCHLVGELTPTDSDPTGERYAFEKGVTKQGGGKGWADVWKRGHFAWEYKGKHKDLDAAYIQLLQYREALENPPLLIVSDIETIRIHTNFTNTVSKIYHLALADLLEPGQMKILRQVFTDPGALCSTATPAEVTETAAREFARLAEVLRKWKIEPQRAARFLIRLLFCLFAEDVNLLPAGMLTRMIELTRYKPARFIEPLRQLFATMHTGGFFGADDLFNFNGGLFADADVVDLDSEAMDILASVSRLDWSSIEPAVFGTLFERSLDPAKRAQLGAHYTSKEDILLIVEPVVMAPLRHRWEGIKQQAIDLATRRDAATGKKRDNENAALRVLLVGFADEIAQIQVLDPACGSGNFLYVALKQLLDLQKEVIILAGELGLTMFLPSASPEQLHGIELNEYAHELAQATIWIGYIQWLRDNGFGQPSEPILKPIESIVRKDAILTYDAAGQPVEPEWPAADVIIGNPPFLGGNKIRKELGDTYVDDLFALYGDRIPAFSDLVCYWFERARGFIAEGNVQRAGLLATNSIRGGANRRVLERIKETGDIFMAWSDRPWVLEGAAVRVSMVGFDDGTEQLRQLDGMSVSTISADLHAHLDLTKAVRLLENKGLAFIGDTKKGQFDITDAIAQEMLQSPTNPNGRSNKDVIRPWINGLDIMRLPRGMWIIDFGVDMKEEEAALYEKPFEYVRKHVKPARDQVRNLLERSHWWIHGRPGPDMRTATQGLQRYIATPRVGKHRLFVYVNAETLSDGQLAIVARDDDYFLGVLQSKVHEFWTLRTVSWFGVANTPRYQAAATFETFPFPWPPGQEPEGDPRVEAIAQAARDLVEKRDAWLNPPGVPITQLKMRTLTNLYNQRPTWLDLAHRALDAAVLDAYGWPRDLTDEQILARLLALNVERAAARGGMAAEAAGEEEEVESEE